MVTELKSDAGTDAWLLRPTRSMTWPEARRFITAVTLVSIAIGTFFLLLGMPLVLPFSGLEAAAVALAFYLVLKDGEQRELIRLDGDQLVIERGSREVEERHEFNRFWVRIDLVAARSRLHPHRLLVASGGNAIELGRFLTEGERESFAQTLINALKKKR